jgi:Protein of unknown function (DUF2959)
MKLFRSSWVLLAAIMLVTATGCRSTYYKAWETFGVYKRDLLKDNVVAARDEQKKASEQFTTALQRLKEMYGYKGGDLEKMYDGMQADYDRSSARATAVKDRVAKVETVAEDLFKEWEQEIPSIQTPSLAASSREKLRATRERYSDLHRAMKRAEASMDPVLAQFKDQVLYLKHNLNAAAIGSLQGEAASIDGEIRKLIKEMNISIAEADKFIAGLQ